jgi:hypothetical protein
MSLIHVYRVVCGAHLDTFRREIRTGVGIDLEAGVVTAGYVQPDAVAPVKDPTDALEVDVEFDHLA